MKIGNCQVRSELLQLREEGESLGEFFLPPDAVQDIVGANRNDGFKPPLYHYSGDHKDYSALRKGEL
ncbi:hypothetical protein [Endozoicomonas atrinae]|uniref:hypothetical protein n=1 Tax=Endozoicomonas atrinae TaxID=1333660 RepID=UPI003B00B8C7